MRLFWGIAMDLVTGGAGKVGQELVALLTSKGRTVRVLDLDPFPQSAVVSGLESVIGDCTSRHDVDSALRGIDVVYHLIGPSYTPGRSSWLTHARAEAVRVVLEGMLRTGASKLVLVSSALVYGVSRGRPFREADTPRPQGPLGESHLMAEQVCRHFHSPHLETAILRPLFVPRHDDGFFSSVVQKLADGKPVWLPGNGTNRCHLIGLWDLATACIQASRKGISGVFNVGVLRPTPLERLLGGVSQGMRLASSLHFIPSSLATAIASGMTALDLWQLDLELQKAASEDRVLDLSRATSELGFSPMQTDLEVLLSLCRSQGGNRSGARAGSFSSLQGTHRDAATWCRGEARVPQ